MRRNLILNVLLMLSTRQPPEPQLEVAWHEQHCAEHGRTFVVTTRDVRGLAPETSTVAFYGDSRIDNLYLGQGRFRRIIPLRSPEGREILQHFDLYREHGIPDRARAFIELTDVRTARPGETLEDLGGIMRTSGLPLALCNIPPGASRAQVYYFTE